MAAYIYLAKMKILTSMAYRFDFLTGFLTNTVLLLSMVFLWKTAFVSTDVVAGVTENDMLRYSIISMLLGTFYQRGVQNTINGKVRHGEVAVDLFHPVNLLGTYLAEDIGTAISSFVTLSLPLGIISVFVLRISLAIEPMRFLLFAMSAVLSFALLWILSAITGLISFWLVEYGNMGLAKDAVITILSGSVVPIWFFPESLQFASKFMPFIYIYQAPISIYIGKMPGDEIPLTLGVQAIWVLLFFALMQLTWSRAKRRVVVQGG